MVIAIIAILAAVIFPVFAKAKRAAKKTGDISNLRQIGTATGIYMADYDDLFPYAADAADKYHPEIWSGHPDFQAQIPYMPMMQEVLHPYTKNQQIFKSPMDTGTQVLDSHPYIDFVSSPSMHAVFGLSYLYRTEICFYGHSQTSIQSPAELNYLFTAGGHWEPGDAPLRLTDDYQTIIRKSRNFRYNVLFGDFHVKSLGYDAYQQAWSTPL